MKELRYQEFLEMEAEYDAIVGKLGLPWDDIQRAKDVMSNTEIKALFRKALQAGLGFPPKKSILF